MAHQPNSINYIEFPMVRNAETKLFYGDVFGWTFTDWGPGYISFEGAGIDGGFNGQSDGHVRAPGVLVVLYASDLLACCAAVEKAGGTILQAIYDFPGGKRFHFEDPNGNELAVWSEGLV
ncbi:MAG: VOC family protein [Parvibaculaceae bacterium]|jgi:predicted enzyme related to lactoylglutathione lyase|nr:VOC family protein [Parvibaculaceae bacterium]